MRDHAMILPGDATPKPDEIFGKDKTWKRGVVLSFASALLQALVAVAIVGIAAALLNVSAPTMATAVRWIEIVSYALIILIGLRLLWVKGGAFIGALQTIHRPAAVGAAVTPAHHHENHDHRHLDGRRIDKVLATRIPSRRLAASRGPRA